MNEHLNNQSRKRFEGMERFLIQRKLGEGSFGEVYQAYDRKRKIDVAIKVLRKINATTLYRFKKEFRALVDIHHPNLVTLYELMAVGEEWFFTMELVKGINFLEYVWEVPITQQESALKESTFSMSTEVQLLHDTQQRSPGKAKLFPFVPHLNLDRLRLALRQLVEGVYVLHNAGKLHRDIKPFNVLVTKEGRVVLLDFGFVVDLSTDELYRSSEQHIVGTIPYMSPEQARGSKVTEASDWYSIGVMLYEALTRGKFPFSGNALDILVNKQKFDAPPPCNFISDIPADLNALCVELLQRNPEDRPKGYEIIQRLGCDTSNVLPPVFFKQVTKQISPFVGRKYHLGVLAEAFRATKEGRSVTVHVSGSSGIGKSSLVRRFLDDLIQQDAAVVLTGRCYEQESVPYKALDSLIDGLSRYLMKLPSIEVEVFMPRDILALARLFPVLERVDAITYAPRRVLETPDPHELKRKASAALRELLTRIADRKPLVLFIDDLQWGDMDSISLITDLIRPPDPPSLLLILAYRSEDAQSSPILNALNQHQIQLGSASEARNLPVEALTNIEVQELVLALLKEDNLSSNYIVDKIFQESAGNPYFVNELVKYVQSATTLSDRFFLTKEISLSEVIWTRILQLSEGLRYLLEITAVAGQPLGRRVIHDVTNLNTEEFEVGISILKNDRLIRICRTQDEEEIETYHDYIRKTVLSHLSSEDLKSYHHRLAVALENVGNVDPEILANHFLKAEDPNKAVEYVALAAKQASEALAFNRAAHLYRLALDLYTVEDDKRQTMLVKLGDALSKAGQGVDSAQAYLLAAQHPSCPNALELKGRATVEFLRCGHIDKGVNLLHKVLDEVEMKLPKTTLQALWSLLLRRIQLRIRGLRFNERDISQISPKDLIRLDICWSAVIGLGAVDRIRAAELHIRSLLLALKVGEPYRISRAMALEANTEATVDAAIGYHTSHHAQKLAKAAEIIAQRIKHPHALGCVAGAAGVKAFWMGEWKNTFERCQEAEKILRDYCTGVAWELNLAQLLSIVALFYLGRLNEIFYRLPILLKEADERNDLFAATNLRIEFVHMLLAEDDVKSAQQILLDAMNRCPEQVVYIQNVHFIIAQCQIYLYQGDGRSAWDHIIKQWSAIARSFSLRTQQLRVQLHDLRARSALVMATTVPDPKPFLRSAKHDAKRIEREKRYWSNPLALVIHAGIANMEGRREDALKLLVSAIKGFEAADMALHKAAAHRRYGELLGGDEGEAIIKSVNAWMRDQKIKNPARMTSLFAPGFPNETHVD